MNVATAPCAHCNRPAPLLIDNWLGGRLFCERCSETYREQLTEAMLAAERDPADADFASEVDDTDPATR